MANPIGTYYQQATSLAVVDNGDFLQLRNTTAIRIEVLEIVVYQTSDVTLAMKALRFQRGVGGSGGTALTEREWDVAGQAPAGACFSLPTVDVGTLDLDVHRGWNILQEYVWLPTPAFPLILKPSDHLGISLRDNTTLTIGCGILWQEYGA